MIRRLLLILLFSSFAVANVMAGNGRLYTADQKAFWHDTQGICGEKRRERMIGKKVTYCFVVSDKNTIFAE